MTVAPGIRSGTGGASAPLGDLEVRASATVVRGVTTNRIKKVRSHPKRVTGESKRRGRDPRLGAFRELRDLGSEDPGWVTLCVSMKPAVLERIDAAAELLGTTRSELMRIGALALIAQLGVELG